MALKTPLAIDLYCGLGGWTDGLIAAGWDVYGFDITRHVYGESKYPGQLILQDALTIHGSQFRNADLIVASPPCQAYSYLAMPWSRSKCPLCKGKKFYFEWQLVRGVAPGHMTEWGRPLPCDCKENSQKAKELRRKWETEGPDNRLFDACFRIQREAIEATYDYCRCGHDRFAHDAQYGCRHEACCMAELPPCIGFQPRRRYIPLIVENVRGAVPWVGKRDMPLKDWLALTEVERADLGRPKASFGSFLLWGDVAQVGDRVYAGSDLKSMRFGGGVAPEVGELKGYGSTWFGIQSNGDTYDQRDVNPVSGQKRQGRNFHTYALTGGAVSSPSYHGGDHETRGVGIGVKVPTDGTGRRTDIGKGARFTSRDCGAEANSPEIPDGCKIGFSDPNSTCRKHGSRSNARKAASAMIAKIPLPLSRYIGEVHKQ